MHFGADFVIVPVSRESRRERKFASGWDESALAATRRS